MAQRDQVFEAVIRAQRNGDGQHHREARKDRARDEVRRKDGRMPAGQNRNREIEADHRVNRNHQRRRQSGQQQVSHLVPLPVPRRTTPAHRQHAVNEPPRARTRTVAQCSQIGNQSDEPEDHRDREVGRDSEHVPDQRAAELRLHLLNVRIRKEPVEKPRTAQVQQRKHSRAHHGEDCHRLGEAVDRGAPFLIQQQQDRRNQRARVPDPDPPDEIDDGESPRHRDVNAPDADALDQQISDRAAEHERQRKPDDESAEPARTQAARQDNRTDLFGDRREALPRADHRRNVRLAVDDFRRQFFNGHRFFLGKRAWSSNFSLPLWAARKWRLQAEA
ncbi:MAG: hypothetical protein JMDDDDMK_01819 [Acidobacteria bacterium]|nr:hypothetical protein [Acidobacteriota bacterium]